MVVVVMGGLVLNTFTSISNIFVVRKSSTALFAMWLEKENAMSL